MDQQRYDNVLASKSYTYVYIVGDHSGRVRVPISRFGRLYPIQASVVRESLKFSSSNLLGSDAIQIWLKYC